MGAGVAALLTMRWLDEVPEQYRARIRCMAFACPAVIPIEQTGKYDTNITSVINTHKHTNMHTPHIHTHTNMHTHAVEEFNESTGGKYLIHAVRIWTRCCPATFVWNDARSSSDDASIESIHEGHKSQRPRSRC